jgi:hypothetical protein
MPRTKSANPLPKMLPGAVCPQFIRCGKSGCRCTGGELHGPYLYHFRREHGRLVKRYVRPVDAPAIRTACSAWRDEQRAARAEHAAQRQRFRDTLATLRQLERGEWPDAEVLTRLLSADHNR